MAQGDHIRARRRGYWHHGIDGGGGFVFHYNGEPGNARDAAVRRTRLERFAKGGEVQVVAVAPAHRRRTIIARAEARLGERRYSLVRNNCEHFATECLHGKARSAQVRSAVKAATALIIAAAGGELGRRAWKAHSEAGA